MYSKDIALLDTVGWRPNDLGHIIYSLVVLRSTAIAEIIHFLLEMCSTKTIRWIANLSTLYALLLILFANMNNLQNFNWYFSLILACCYLLNKLTLSCIQFLNLNIFKIVFIHFIYDKISCVPHLHFDKSLSFNSLCIYKLTGAFSAVERIWLHYENASSIIVFRFSLLSPGLSISGNRGE